MHTLQKVILTCSFLMMGSANAFTNSETHPTTVSAEIEANPCVVTMPSAITFNVINASSLPPYNSNMSAPTAANDPQHIDIVVSNCPSGQQAYIAVSGTVDTRDPSLLANTATENAATNVGIAFWDQSTGTSKLLEPNPFSTSSVVNIAYQGRFYLVAGLAKTHDAPSTPGEVAAAAQVIISYL
jgi:type 1 fimbria pilin